VFKASTVVAATILAAMEDRGSTLMLLSTAVVMLPAPWVEHAGTGICTAKVTEQRRLR